MAWVQALGLLSALAGTTDLPDLTPGRLVTVYGEAQEQVAPDVVSVSLSVQADKPTADESFTAEGEAMAALVAALKGAGLAPNDLHTLGPTINRIFKGAPAGTPPARSNSVREVLTVNLSVLDRLRDVVRAAQAQGAEVEGLHYDITSRKPRQDALRAAAVEDARRRAEVYAQAAGLKLGGAHAVVEEGANLVGALMRGYQNPQVDTNPGGAVGILLKEGVYVSYDLAPP